MEQLFGGIQRALGAGLNGFYELTGSYAIAIILLTVIVRALLVPLTLKQTRSMKSMQELQPQVKQIQQKYKAMQQKAKDRAELQQIRMEMNREVQGIYRERGVNPLGGCLPLLAQMPVFIAMFSIMRAAIVILPMTVTLVDGAALPADAFAGKDLRKTVCRPSDVTGDQVTPSVDGSTPTTISCAFPDDEEPTLFKIGDLKNRDGEDVTSAPWLAQCQPVENKIKDAEGVETVAPGFTCKSALGTGHVPIEGELFADLSRDGASILGLHPGCSASQVASENGIKLCTTSKGEDGGESAFPYYLLVGLIAASSWYQSKQMQARNSAQVTDQQRMMTRIMPVLFAFISLSIPAGANTYFLASNVWTIGQQHLMFRGSQTPDAGKRPLTSREAPVEQRKTPPERSAPKPNGGQRPANPGQQRNRSKKKKKRR